MKKLVIKIFVFFCIFFILLQLITEIFKPKWINTYADNVEPATTIVDGFYENNDKLDVVFVGTSNVYENINPLTLFEDNGIVGYDFATASQTMSQTYSFVKEAIQKKNPKVIVMDVYGLIYNGSPREDRARRSIDNIPFSLNKIEFINNITAGANIRTFTDYAFPIKRYHSRWSELVKEDYTYPFKEKHYAYRGHQAHFNTVKCEDFNYNEEVSFKGFTELSKKYFIKTIELCESTGTPLVLVKSPNVNWKKVHSDEVAKLIQPYNIKFLDYAKEYKEIGISETDCFRDTGRHMNSKGVRIYTNAIGGYLKENYHIEDHRKEKVYSYIYNDLAVYYQDEKSYKISHMKDVKLILEAIDNNYNVYYNINSVDLTNYNSQFCELLKVKGIDLTNNKSGENMINDNNINDSFLQNTGINIVIYDKLTKRVISSFSVSEKLAIDRKKKTATKSDL